MIVDNSAVLQPDLGEIAVIGGRDDVAPILGERHVKWFYTATCERDRDSSRVSLLHQALLVSAFSRQRFIDKMI